MSNYYVTEKQVLKNRAGITEMWKTKIKPSWVDLDTILEAPDPNDKTDLIGEEVLAHKCDGKGGPTNTCGAVGCFAGWNMTYHPYQQWCRRVNLDITSFDSLSVYLGLPHFDALDVKTLTHHDDVPDWHDLFSERENYSISQWKEVNHRIKKMNKMDVYLTEKEF